MNHKIVSQLDGEGFFLAAVVADESPLEPGVFLLPAGAVDKSPPAVLEAGKRYKPWGAGWRGEVIPIPEPEPEPPAPTAAEIRKAEIMGRLYAIDTQSARPLREVLIAIAAGQPAPDFAKNKIAALEGEAAAIRAELAGL